MIMLRAREDVGVPPRQSSARWDRDGRRMQFGIRLATASGSDLQQHATKSRRLVASTNNAMLVRGRRPTEPRTLHGLRIELQTHVRFGPSWRRSRHVRRTVRVRGAISWCAYDGFGTPPEVEVVVDDFSDLDVID